MSMDFSAVKEWTILEGKVASVSVNGAQIWSGTKPEPPVRLSWEHVLWSIENNRYTTDYSIGDLIPLNLGTEGNINMQIAGFNVDDLASESGKAHISFIGKALLKTSHSMNPALSPSSAPYDEGTGTIGGWKDSAMRNYINTTIASLFPQSLISRIVEVAKSSNSYTSDGSKISITSNDKLWIPSWSEVASSTEGIYTQLFPDDNSRRKRTTGSSGAYNTWWTRQASSESKFYYFKSDGTVASRACTYNEGIALGFCL